MAGTISYVTWCSHPCHTVVAQQIFVEWMSGVEWWFFHHVKSKWAVCFGLQIFSLLFIKKNASAVFHKNRYLLFLTTDCKKVHTVASLLHYPRGICFKTPSRCLKPRITPNSITVIFFPCAYILFYLKKALYGFYLAYLNCQHHYSCALGHY